MNLGDTYRGGIAGTVESGSSFRMPPELQDQPFVCSIGKAKMGPFKIVLGLAALLPGTL